MASIAFEHWWKAQEIPLAEIDWRNIGIYCGGDQDILSAKGCIYIFRLSPPFVFAYGRDKRYFESPLIYVGSGSVDQRWQSHRLWLSKLATELPGARYEVWIKRIKVRNNVHAYRQIEGDILAWFRKKTGFLPLINQRGEKPGHHKYPEAFFEDLAKPDRRYRIAIYPTDRSRLSKAYYRTAEDE